MTYFLTWEPCFYSDLTGEEAAAAAASRFVCSKSFCALLFKSSDFASRVGVATTGASTGAVGLASISNEGT